MNKKRQARKEKNLSFTCCGTMARVLPVDLRGFPHHSSCKHFKRTIYVKVQLVGGGSYHCPPEELDPLLTEIEEGVDCGNAGEEWVITLVEMSPMEYAALPEFTGH